MLIFCFVFEAKEKSSKEKQVEFLEGKRRSRKKRAEGAVLVKSVALCFLWTICCVTVSSELSLFGRREAENISRT